MASFAIGDVHGCFRTLTRLLEKIDYRPGLDTLWFVGDLVNRGPGSLAVLRWVAENADADSILGNHDLHFLACARGVSKPRRGDTLKELLKAAECPQLVDWLKSRPLLARCRGHEIVHAGLLPAWSLDTAGRLARDAERRLRGKKSKRFLKRLVGARNLAWSRALGPLNQAVAATQILTRLRTCRPDGTPCFRFAGPPERAPAPCRPWYELRGPEAEPFVFGHWAALGYRRLARSRALDSGCGWGGALTALRLDDGADFRVGNLDLARSSNS